MKSEVLSTCKESLSGGGYSSSLEKERETRKRVERERGEEKCIGPVCIGLVAESTPWLALDLGSSVGAEKEEVQGNVHISGGTWFRVGFVDRVFGRHCQRTRAIEPSESVFFFLLPLLLFFPRLLVR